MKLHDSYSMSSAIKQVMIIEKLSLLDLSNKVSINLYRLNLLVNGEQSFNMEDIIKLETTFPYMRGRIE